MKKNSHKLLGQFVGLCVLGILSSCGGNKDNGQDGQADKAEEGQACAETVDCISGLICKDATCIKVCVNNRDCGKQQACKDSQCTNVDNAQCSADEQCIAFGSCEILAGAYCEAGMCHYNKAQEGTLCNDYNDCTADDHCDGTGKCVGTEKICNNPQAAHCSDDDTKYLTYDSIGKCNLGQCEYAEHIQNCDNCLEQCAGVCDQILCPSSNKDCVDIVCDPTVAGDDKCVNRNTADGTICHMVGDVIVETQHYCYQGTCVECIHDDQCGAADSLWPSCYDASCRNNQCVYTIKDKAMCGQRCVDGKYYNYGICELADVNAPNSATCAKAVIEYCDGYSCNADGTACLTSCSSHADCTADYYCSGGLCIARNIDGADGCTDSAMCVSNYCDQSTDLGPETGRCCMGPECCDSNEDCLNDMVCKNNVCTSDAVGRHCDKNSDCNSVTFCDPINKVCVSKHAKAHPCTNNDECVNGQCVDGVCCQTSACGLCEACNVTGNGECSVLPGGLSDPDSCAEEDGRICVGSNKCLKRNGIECSSNNECESSNCTDSVCCATSSCGTCESCAMPGYEGKCEFVGEGNNDQDTCPIEFNKKCKSPGQCLKIDGQTANHDSECLSGYAVDGYCCNDECSWEDKKQCTSECKYDLYKSRCNKTPGVCQYVAEQLGLNVDSGNVCNAGTLEPPSATKNCGDFISYNDGCAIPAYYRSCNGNGSCRTKKDITGATQHTVYAPEFKMYHDGVIEEAPCAGECSVKIDRTWYDWLNYYCDGTGKCSTEDAFKKYGNCEGADTCEPNEWNDGKHCEDTRDITD